MIKKVKYLGDSLIDRVLDKNQIYTIEEEYITKKGERLITLTGIPLFGFNISLFEKVEE